MSETETIAALTGFVPKRRTRRVVCDWIEPADGAAPFAAEIVTSLTFAEIDAIPTTGTYTDLFAHLAPLVVAWNAHAIDAETGAYAPVPPPAEAGPDAFRLVDPAVFDWLWMKLRTVHLGDVGARQKKAPTSATTDAPPSATGSR